MSEPIIDEQIQAIRVGLYADVPATSDPWIALGEAKALGKLAVIALDERDTQLATAWADLRQCQQDLSQMTRAKELNSDECAQRSRDVATVQHISSQLRAEIAELRKPSVQGGNPYIESIRNEWGAICSELIGRTFDSGSSASVIAHLLSAYDKSQQDLARTRAELDSLKQPLTNIGRGDIESHRETLLSQVLRQIREACPAWADVDVDVRNDLIQQWRVRLNKTSEDLARTVNAWQVAMHDAEHQRSMLSDAESHERSLSKQCSVLMTERDAARSALAEAEARERGLREALEWYAADVTYENDRADYGSTYVSVPHTAAIYSDNGRKARAALAQPQAEPMRAPSYRSLKPDCNICGMSPCESPEDCIGRPQAEQKEPKQSGCECRAQIRY